MEISEENVSLIPIVRTVMNETTRPLAPIVAEALLPNVHRESRVLRILTAVQSKRVNDAIELRRKRAIEAARTARA